MLYELNSIRYYMKVKCSFKSGSFNAVKEHEDYYLSKMSTFQVQ